MIQTIEVKLEIEDLPVSKKSEFIAKLSSIFKEALSAKVEFTDLELYEEAEIISQTSSRERLRQALEQISREPLWGEVDTVDIEAAKANGEWQDGSYFPSSITESESLGRVVRLARETLQTLDREMGIAEEKPKTYAVATSLVSKPPSRKQQANSDNCQKQLFE